MNNSYQILKVENLTSSNIDSSGSRHLSFEDINLSLDKGQFKSILAPKGSGKTTLFKILAGLGKSDSGIIHFIQDETKHSDTALITSRPSSLPWLSVKDNIKYVLNLMKMDVNDTYIKEAVKMVGLSGYENHFPHNNSIGYRFRISLARALAVKPKVILIDEPFNDLDEITKKEIYDLLQELHQNQEVSFLLATSSIKEAVLLSDAIMLFKKAPFKMIKELDISLHKQDSPDPLHSESFIKIYDEVERIYLSELETAKINLIIA